MMQKKTKKEFDCEINIGGQKIIPSKKVIDFVEPIFLFFFYFFFDTTQHQKRSSKP